jgi:hypothetical protein
MAIHDAAPNVPLGAVQTWRAIREGCGRAPPAPQVLFDRLEAFEKGMRGSR